MPPQTPVGLIGVGLMGEVYARRLIAAGFGVIGFDIDPARNERITQIGGRTGTLTDIARQCDPIVVAVFSTDQVEDVIERALLPGAAGKIVICTSTCDPDRIAALGGRVTPHLRFLEVPVSGTSAQVRQGDGVGLVGGDVATAQIAAPVLEALFPRRFHIGEIGDGGRAKLAINLILGLNRLALAEGLVFATRLRLDPAAFLEVARASAAASQVMDTKGSKMVASDFAPEGRVRQTLKDTHLMLDQAGKLGQELPLLAVHAAVLEACIRHGNSEMDNSIVIEEIRRRGRSWATGPHEAVSQCTSGSSVMPDKSSALAHDRVSARAPEIVMMDACALANAIHSEQVSCVEVMTAYLDHIENINPHVNAIVALEDSDSLLAQARESDEQLARGEPVGSLHGFPFAAKDLIPVKGLRMTMGSPILKDFIPDADSVMAERLRRAGAIFIGKTNTPEFGLGSNTYNAVYGITRNAYDQSRSAGGSSGGAAVALALRMLPVADGSDYGGSLRNPAGWNNVFGFRTSYGRIPADGRDAWLPSMGVLGPMARNVRDLAMLLAVQTGYDDRVPLSMTQNSGLFQTDLERDFKGTRIAWLRDFNGQVPYESGVLELCERALKNFEAIGCIVEVAQPDYPIESVWRAWLRLRAWQSGGALLAYYNDPSKRALMKPEAIFEVESGLKLSAFDITAASAVRTEWYLAVRRFFKEYDYFIAPTAQLFPFDANLDWPKEIAGRKMATYHEWMKGVLPITMAGCPALAAPAGFNVEGLPIGIQIVARNHGERSCLELAHAYETVTNQVCKRLPRLLA